jgi:hypothetical protein
MVNGISGSFCVQLPTDTYAVARLRAGRVIDPVRLPVFTSLLGQRAIRPAEGPAVAESMAMVGLSHTRVLMLLRKNDPS